MRGFYHCKYLEKKQPGTVPEREKQENEPGPELMREQVHLMTTAPWITS